jgi:AcrR family transcriptional regulator
VAKNKDDSVKERIIDASIKLFLAHGFVGTTVSELTTAAGVAKGTLYWYFKSKNEILEDILDKYASEFYGVVYERVNGCEGDTVKKFKTLYRYITEFAREKRELLLVANTLLGEIVGSSSDAEKKMKRIQMQFHGFLKDLLDTGIREGVIRKDLNTDVQAHVIIASFIGMHLQWCIHGDSFDAATYARLFRNTILRGIGVDLES